jgi:hypothetical protein
MYKLYSVGGGTESRGTPAYIYLGIDITPSTETFHSVRNELISLITLVDNSNLDNS